MSGLLLDRDAPLFERRQVGQLQHSGFQRSADGDQLGQRLVAVRTTCTDDDIAFPFTGAVVSDGVAERKDVEVRLPLDQAEPEPIAKLDIQPVRPLCQRPIHSHADEPSRSGAAGR